MAEQIASIGIGALSAMDDFASGHDNPSSQQAPSNPPPAATAPSSRAAVPSEATVQAAVQQINLHLARVNRVLSLKIDPASGYTVAQISNAQTGEVLQQIPTEDGIHLAQMLTQWSHGGNVLLDLIA